MSPFNNGYNDTQRDIYLRQLHSDYLKTHRKNGELLADACYLEQFEYLVYPDYPSFCKKNNIEPLPPELFWLGRYLMITYKNDIRGGYRDIEYSLSENAERIRQFVNRLVQVREKELDLLEKHLNSYHFFEQSYLDCILAPVSFNEAFYKPHRSLYKDLIRELHGVTFSYFTQEEIKAFREHNEYNKTHIAPIREKRKVVWAPHTANTLDLIKHITVKRTGSYFEARNITEEEFFNGKGCIKNKKEAQRAVEELRDAPFFRVPCYEKIANSRKFERIIDDLNQFDDQVRRKFYHTDASGKEHLLPAKEFSNSISIIKSWFKTGDWENIYKLQDMLNDMALNIRYMYEGMYADRSDPAAIKAEMMFNRTSARDFRRGSLEVRRAFLGKEDSIRKYPPRMVFPYSTVKNEFSYVTEEPMVKAVELSEEYERNLNEYEKYIKEP